MSDNDGRQIAGYLPTLKFNTANPVVQVVDDASGEILYTERIQGKEYRPRVFGGGSFTVKAGKDKPEKVIKSSIMAGEGTIEAKV